MDARVILVAAEKGPQLFAEGFTQRRSRVRLCSRTAIPLRQAARASEREPANRCVPGKFAGAHVARRTLQTRNHEPSLVVCPRVLRPVSNGAAAASITLPRPACLRDGCQ